MSRLINNYSILYNACIFNISCTCIYIYSKIFRKLHSVLILFNLVISNYSIIELESRSVKHFVECFSKHDCDRLRKIICYDQ